MGYRIQNFRTQPEVNQGLDVTMIPAGRFGSHESFGCQWRARGPSLNGLYSLQGRGWKKGWWLQDCEKNNKKHMFTYSYMSLLCGNWPNIGNLWFKRVCSSYTNHWCLDGVLLLKSTTLYILMGMITITIHELGLYNPFLSNQLAIIAQNDMSRFERGAHKTSSEYSTTLPHEQTGR